MNIEKKKTINNIIHRDKHNHTHTSFYPYSPYVDRGYMGRTRNVIFNIKVMPIAFTSISSSSNIY